MPDFTSLTRTLHDWDTRRRQQELLARLPIGLSIGLILAFIVAILSRIRPLFTQAEIAVLALALALISLSITALAILLRRRSLEEQARFADRYFALRERTTAAVQINAGRLPTSIELAQRQLQDTLATARAIDLSRQMPLTLRARDWLPVLITLIVLVLAILMPNQQVPLLLEQRALDSTLAEQTAALEALAESIAANDDLTAEQQSALQQPIDEALENLSESSLSREEAVATLSQTEAELRSLQEQFGNRALENALGQSGTALAQTEAGSALAEAFQSGQLENAAQAASNLAGELDSLPHGVQQELAEQLAEAAAALEAVDSELADRLQASAETLAAGETGAAEENLLEAAALLEDRAQDQAAAAQAQQAASALNLARQEIAQATNPAEDGEGESAGDSQVTAGSFGASATSQDGSVGTDQGTGEGQQPGTGNPTQGGGRSENVYVPPAVDLGDNQGVDLELPVQCLGDPETCGPPGEQLPGDPNDTARLGGSVVPYEQVFGNYRATVNEALSSGNIPLGLQNLVRDYFTALEP
ncbi:MAG: hypothetical protein R6X18_19645 [Chloroflexota bacterium]|jgi:hypothetical protein